MVRWVFSVRESLQGAALVLVVSCAANPRGARPKPVEVTRVAPTAPEDATTNAVPEQDGAAAPVGAAPAATRKTGLQGYLGKRPIRGALGEENGVWKGSYHFIGNVDRSLEGTLQLDDNPAPALGTGLKDGECSFTERDARGTVTASLEGTCETNGYWFTFRGERKDVSGAVDDMFLCNTTGDAAGFERYERALLRTPGPDHGCPPLLHVDQVSIRAGAPTWVLYRLGWACESTEWPTPNRPNEVLPPLEAKLYRALIDESDPTRFLDVGILTNEVVPEEEVSLEFVPWPSNLTLLRLELKNSWGGLGSGFGEDGHGMLAFPRSARRQHSR